MCNFFQKIIYSSSNEDGFSEMKALNITQNDVVLAITGSGARSLDLLIKSPKKVISIDFNKTQNYLLRLKIIGYTYLNYEDFLVLMWIHNPEKSLEIFEKIKYYLDEESKSFFENNSYLFKKGIIYSGVWEKINILFSKVFFFKRRKIQKLFASKNIEEQKNYWEKEFDNRCLRWWMRIITNRFLWRYVIREPGTKLVKKDFNITNYMIERLQHLMQVSLLRENDFANLIFLGRYTYTLPLHLQKEYFEIIKQNINKIEVIDASLLEYVKDSSKTKEITCFSLSDFCSYASDDFYLSVWENIVKNSQKWAKFCERQFLVKQNPEMYFSQIQRNNSLEKEVENTDKTFIYTFCIWYIQH